MNRSLLLLALLLTAMPTLASMRCGTALVTLGDTVDQVQEKCGAPDQRRIEVPVQRPANAQRFNAVDVQHWAYDSSNGAVRTLRFIEGKLVNISTERQR